MRIYENAENVIVNAEDKQTYPTQAVNFLIDFAEKDAKYHFDDNYLYCDQQIILPISELKMTGRHNLLNALVSVALADATNVPRTGVIKALQSYSGLDHRFQLVPTNDGVTWINDSKATNVGSTIAALNGLQITNKCYLLLGGDGKGADFSELKPFINQPNMMCYCFGQDGKKLAELTENSVVVETMAQAIEQIRPLLEPSDMVLLSPACASLDQFPNFEIRGQQFMQLAQNNIMGESDV